MNIFKHLILIVFGFGILLSTVSVSKFGNDGKIQHILILNSYHADFRLGREAIDGIRETLNNSFPGIGINVHYMDTMRYSEKIAWPLVYDTVKAKYTRKKPTIIIAMDNSALEFLMVYRNELFPKIPIVFSGVNFYEPDMIKGHEKWITGVTEDFSFRGTVRLMLQLHIDLEYVVVLHTPTLTGRLLDIKTRKDMNSIFQKADVAVTHWIDYTFAQLSSKLRSMPPNSALILTGMHRDITGEAFSSTEAENEFLKNNLPDHVPVYSFWNIYDDIMVGGLVFDGRTHGIQVAKKVIGLIRGVNIKHSPVEPPIVQKMFYYKKLVKFGIKEDRLPSDAIIVGKTTYGGIIEKYGIAFLAITFIQIMILVFWFAKRSPEAEE